MRIPSLRLPLLLGAFAVASLLTRPDSTEAARSPYAGERPGVFPWRLALAMVALATLMSGGFAAWRGWQAQARTIAVAKALTRGDPARAPALITRYGCGGCHTIPGAPGADGRVAAPLGGMRERVYVGGVARNDAETLIRWIVAPQSLSPRSAMPTTGISEAEARDVAAFLYAH